MESIQLCPCCEKEVMELDDSGKVCDLCGDIIEFGYPSFPAYLLEEHR